MLRQSQDDALRILFQKAKLLTFLIESFLPMQAPSDNLPKNAKPGKVTVTVILFLLLFICFLLPLFIHIYGVLFILFIYVCMICEQIS